MVTIQDIHNTSKCGLGQDYIMIAMTQDIHGTFKHGLGHNYVIIVITQDVHGTFTNGLEQDCVMAVVAQDIFKNGLGQDNVMVEQSGKLCLKCIFGLEQNRIRVVIVWVHSTSKIDLGNCSSDPYVDSDSNLVPMLCRML